MSLRAEHVDHSDRGYIRPFETEIIKSAMRGGVDIHCIKLKLMIMFGVPSLPGSKLRHAEL